ncbi:hypothetical protein M427DRAFT_52990 [Gonapodya prolifera JEL478]|uniref:Uncharacterized protein n=1 Tax=Gonapodya prolifera (strain JEL478) TaxID=1344416 RepID=A0A139AS49_GONPJ|nr:hypothetical protein M427DRAFT_52990 [Gonapodya prolifera JEL478]|eukprot:KXS19578.1 hypothetical protein M427DRAFT_52990 [Gonapodya prolifera JEL478]
MLQPGVQPKPSSLYRTNAIADFILPSQLAAPTPRSSPVKREEVARRNQESIPA